MPPISTSSGARAARRQRPLLWSLLLVLVTGGAFWQARDGEFLLWDDGPNIYENPLVVRGAPEDLVQIWSAPYRAMYLPVTYTAWFATARIAARDGNGGALDPRPFHLCTLAFHCASVLVLFALLRGLARDDRAAAGGALLFALHPLQVESVAWASGLKDVLFGFFALAALHQYVRFARKSSAGARGSGASYALGTLLFVVSLLTKPTAVVVPVLAGLLDVGLVRRSPRRALRAVLPWMALALARAVAVFALQPVSAASVTTPLHLRPFVAGDAVAHYVHKALLPIGLGPIYGRTPEWLLSQPLGYVTWLVPAFLLVLAWRVRRNRPWVATSIAVFIAGLLPVSGLAPFVFQDYSTVADRYAYVPMLGAALLLAGALRGGSTRRYAVALAGLAALTVVSVRQVGFWHDSERLFTRTLEIHPASAVAHNNLGKLALDRGDRARATEHFRAALEIRSDYPAAHKNLALALIQEGKLKRADRHLRTALRILPDYPEAHFNRGYIQQELGDLDGARESYIRTLELDARHVPARINLARVAAERGDRAGAMELLREALRIAPDSPEANANLGVLLAGAGRPGEAVPHLRRALELRPDLVHLEPILKQALAAP